MSKNPDHPALQRRGYRFDKKIGNGSFSKVYLVRYDEVPTGRKLVLACKSIDKKRAFSENALYVEKFLPREIQILQQIKHPNIIEVHSILETEATLYIFMRYAERGDLIAVLTLMAPIGETRAAFWFAQLASAVNYLHSQNISHRDLKCENVLVTTRMNIMLADFGFARSCTDKNNKNILSNTYCGSHAYAAPEVLMELSYDPLKSDVWSLGIILFIMLHDQMPFVCESTLLMVKEQQERKYNCKSKVQQMLSKKCKEMLEVLLEPKPEDRLGMEMICKLPFITEVRRH